MNKFKLNNNEFSCNDYKIKLSETQLEFVLSDEKHVCMTHGFGAGGTTALITKALLNLNNTKIVYFCLPNFEKIIAENILSVLRDSDVNYKYNDEENSINIFDSVIDIISLVDYDIIENKYDNAYIDELGVYEEIESYYRKVRLSLKNIQSTINTVVVPEITYGHEVNGIFDLFFNKKTRIPNSKIISLNSKENKHLPLGFVDLLKTHFSKIECSGYINGHVVTVLAAR